MRLFNGLFEHGSKDCTLIIKCTTEDRLVSISNFHRISELNKILKILRTGTQDKHSRFCHERKSYITDNSVGEFTESIKSIKDRLLVSITLTNSQLI